MEIFLASGNAHKKIEIQELFPEHTFLIPKDRGITFDPEENGNSFFENSLIKAKELWEIVHQPVIADDSGICVSILNNRPGIYSARYCGKDAEIGSMPLSSGEQNRLLIEEVNYTITSQRLKGPAETLRRCFYVCSMVFYYDDFKYASVQETMEGYVISDINQQRGKGGFGYDPIVFLPAYEKTVAELTPDEKNRISHRGKACALLKPLIQLTEKSSEDRQIISNSY